MPLVRARLAFITSLVRARLSWQVAIMPRRHPGTLGQRAIRRPQVRLTDNPCSHRIRAPSASSRM
jgi:hypothetical protein